MFALMELYGADLSDIVHKPVERMQKILNYYSNSSEKGIAG